MNKAKKKQDSSTKQISKSLIFILIFCEGLGVMTIEMVASRLIAPTFGSSFVVWVCVLAAMITGLAGGYYFGGKKAKKEANFNLAISLLSLSALFIVLAPFLANLFTFDFNIDYFTTSIILLSLLYVCLPMFLLGATSTLLIATANENKIHNASGLLYGTSTIAGIAGAIIIGFYLIPAFGLKNTCAIIFLLIMIPVFYSSFILKNTTKIVGIAGIGVLIIFLNLKLFTFKNKDGKIVFHEEGLMGQLLVIDKINSNANSTQIERIFYVNRMGQTWINLNTGLSIWDYVNYITSIVSTKPENSDVLLLGLGGGTVANYLTTYNKCNVDAVEFDERIADVAKKYFNLSSNIKINIDDARHFLKKNKKKYDIVIFDVFKGEIPPHHVLSIEALKDLKNSLKQNSIVIVNFNGFVNGEYAYPSQCILKTLKESGFEVTLFPTGTAENDRNMLFLATLGKPDIQNPRIKLNIGGIEKNLTELHINNQVLENKNAQILSDDKPFLEFANLKAANEWRKSYHEYHTKKYKQEGIPLFN